MDRRIRPALAAWFVAVLALGAGAAGHPPSLAKVKVSGTADAVVVETSLLHAFSPEIEADLRTGLRTVFQWQFRIRRHRSVWSDPTAARLNVFRAVTYDLLERQYHLEEWQGDEPPRRHRTADLAEVREFLSRVPATLRMRRDERDSAESYFAAVRVIVKASQLPEAVKGSLFFLDWDLETEWRRSRLFRLDAGGAVPPEP